ncbi:uroporphyrinogen-III synthase [Bacillus rubiinfantis]|uniref:uroporphyrinogen-III synthase n=1 Tax=Bacillus rubiinfantis TaxID=1499680 RepID=UPI0005AA5AC2|nr:uroporphyrinogen-III synthase [Bacillus rubiinfantis]
MIKTLPLTGKKILVPRGKQQAASLSKLIVDNGGIPIEIPLLAFRPVAANQMLEECLARLDTYDWLIFTSNVTVETFFSFPIYVEGLPKIAVIGKRTEAILHERGLDVTFVPTAYVAEAFVEEFLPLIHKGTRVLIPKGNLARDFIAASLRNAGAEVDEVVIYETYLPEASRTKLAAMLSEGNLDILTFTSPSTVDHLMQVVQEYGLQEQLKACIIACIGPVTEKRLRDYKLLVHASPSQYTIKDMINSLTIFLTQEQG